MGWTQLQIDTLKAAIADGAREVMYSNSEGTKKVTYHSLKEMLDALARMEAEVNPPADPCATGGTLYPTYSKGLIIP